MHDIQYPILYSFRRCPYAIRARLALAVAGVDVELREVVLRDKPEAMLTISGKGTVPVLQLPNQVIDESEDVMRWALAQHDPNGWLSGESSAARKLIDFNDGDFKHWLDRYKYHQRHPQAEQVEYRRNAEVFLQKLEACLVDNAGQALTGESTRLADAAIFPFIRQFAGVQPDWFSAASYPLLRAWLQRWLDSKLFRSVMKKYPQWQPGQAVVIENWPG